VYLWNAVLRQVLDLNLNLNLPSSVFIGGFDFPPQKGELEVGRAERPEISSSMSRASGGEEVL
jgi:hypothetical protein